MKRSLIFARRNLKEILRDPLSYVFCVGFPVVMLVIFRVISGAAGNVYWFELYRMMPGICVFSFSFVMLYLALLVSNDRASSFLTRLCSTPMRPAEFVLGYAVPGFLIGLAQVVLCYLTGIVMLLIDGAQFSLTGIIGTFAVGFDQFGGLLVQEMTLPWGGMLLSLAAFLSVILMFLSFGILFGSLFGNKSASGVASIVVSLSGFISGIWMPLETMGSFEMVCRVFPFYPSVLAARDIFLLNPLSEKSLWGVLCVLIWTAALLVAAILAFRRSMKGGR